MRVIAGDFKGRRLKTLDNLNVRPTADRLRETVFNILGPKLAASSFLDLCAGSGAIGIEALSRGAAEVTFVEQSRRAHQVISDNLRHCRVTEGVHVVNRDVLTALKYFAARGLKFDLVYLDPPYDSEVYSPALFLIGTRELLNDGGLVVAEHRRNRQLPEQCGVLRRYRELRQGDSALSFYHAVAAGGLSGVEPAVSQSD